MFHERGKDTADTLLTKVTKEDIAKGVKDAFGALYSKDEKRLLRGVACESYCIKPGTQVICDLAFDYLIWNLDHNEGAVIMRKRLTDITIPDSVTHIGYAAFSYCRGLASISIPNSVSNIGEDALNNCDALAEIRILEGSYDKFKKLLPGLEDKFVET